MKAQQHQSKALKGKHFDGVIQIKGVKFHIKGVVLKNFVARKTCLIKTKVNKKHFIKADIVKKLIEKGFYNGELA